VISRLPQLSTTRLVLGVTALAVVYFLVAGGFSAVRSHQLAQEEDRLAGEVSSLQRRYERLAALREYLNSDEYLEYVAREQLGLVREGETGIVVISTVPTPAPAPGQESAGSELWWDTLIR